MKKAIGIAVGILSILSAASPALAANGYPTGYLPAAQCNVPPDNGIYDPITGSLTGCITAAAEQAAQAEVTARGGQNLPTVAPGAIVTDQWGFSTQCPNELIMGHNVCVNLTGTDAYKTSMLQTRNDLLSIYGSKAAAIAAFPMFAKLINY